MAHKFDKRDSELPEAEEVFDRNNNNNAKLAVVEEFEITVDIRKKKVAIPIQQRECIRELARKISALIGVPPQLLQLKHNNRVLEHQFHLHDYQINSNCEIQIIITSSPNITSSSSNAVVSSTSRLRSATTPAAPALVGIHRGNSLSEISPQIAGTKQHMPDIPRLNLSGGATTTTRPTLKGSKLDITPRMPGNQLLLEVQLPQHLRRSGSSSSAITMTDTSSVSKLTSSQGSEDDLSAVLKRGLASTPEPAPESTTRNQLFLSQDSPFRQHRRSSLSRSESPTGSPSGSRTDLTTSGSTVVHKQSFLNAISNEPTPTTPPLEDYSTEVTSRHPLTSLDPKPPSPEIKPAVPATQDPVIDPANASKRHTITTRYRGISDPTRPRRMSLSRQHTGSNLIPNSSFVQADFLYKERSLQLSLRKDTPGSEIYKLLRFRIPELRDLDTFHIVHKSTTLLNSDKVKMPSVSPDAPKLSFRVVHGINIHAHLGEQVLEHGCSANTTTLELYEAVASYFSIDSESFYLTHEGNLVQCDTIEVFKLFPALPQQIDIKVHNDFTLNITTEKIVSPIKVPVNATVASLYALVATQQGKLIQNFYLSIDNVRILPPEHEAFVLSLIEQNEETTFYLMDRSDTIKVDVRGCDLPIGLPLDATMDTLWKNLDELMPSAVGFISESLCTIRPPYFDTDAKHIEKTLLRGVKTLEVTVIPREDAVFANIIVNDEDELPVPICAHPELAICDMFDVVLGHDDPYRYQLLGPDYSQIDVSQPEWVSSVKQYLEAFPNLEGIPSFRVKSRLMRNRVYSAPRDRPIPNLEEGSAARRLHMRSDSIQDFSAEKRVAEHDTTLVVGEEITVEVKFKSSDQQSLLFRFTKTMPVSSLYMHVSKRTGAAINSFALSPIPNLYLDRSTATPIHEYTLKNSKSQTHSLVLFFVTPKDPSYASLLPIVDERTRSPTVWANAFKPSLKPCLEDTEVIQLCVIEGGNQTNLNCFKWFDIAIVKASIQFELHIPEQHQALIFNGRLLKNSEMVFALAEEGADNAKLVRRSRKITVNVILVTDKGVANAIKFTMLYAQPPESSSLAEPPPDTLQDATLCYNYLASLNLDIQQKANQVLTPENFEKLFRIAEKQLKDALKRGTNNLNFNHLMAIYLWTTDILYHDVNRAIRNEAVPDKWDQFLKNFVYAIKTLPICVPGIGYRGCEAMDEATYYKEGKLVWWKNITGISSDIKAAKKFCGNPGVLFEVSYISGRDISPYSQHPSEKEIILLPYTHFRVLQVNKTNERLTFVRLQEVQVPTALKVIFWVDDNPRNNIQFISGAEQKGISVVTSRTTKEALENLEHFKWVMNLQHAEFRIVTDMVRKEDGKMNYEAGIDLIEKIRLKYNFHHEIMIFCMREAQARDSCQKRNVTGHHVTADPAKLDLFLNFSPVATLTNIVMP